MFTLTVSMKLILQLSLIVILWNHAVARRNDHVDEKWVKFENINLQILDNSTILRGEKNNVNDSWYQHITWLTAPTGDLTLNVYDQYDAKPGECIRRRDYAPTNAVPLLSNAEAANWNEVKVFFRAALGLNTYFTLPGKVRVPSSIFTSFGRLRFPQIDLGENSYQISVDVLDYDKNIILTGCLVANRANS